MKRSLAILLLAAACAWAAAASAGEGAVGAADSTDAKRGLSGLCEFGIATAFHGEIARAESAFVQLLAESPGDARALTNLGNIQVLRGYPERALALYDRAAAADTLDAGIVLDEATALLLLGDDQGAAERMQKGTAMAGGVSEAANLMGLRIPKDRSEAPKAAAKSRLSKEELLALLRGAARKVPSDSTHASPSAGEHGESGGGGPKDPRAPTWRSAAARAGDPDVASILYWKR